MSPSTRQQRLLGGVLLALIAAALTWAHFRSVTNPGTGGDYTTRDFMTLWTGSKALLVGLNPYDPDVWGPLRETYGSTWIPNRTSPYPMWTFVLLWPLSLAGVRLSAAVWLTVTELALAASLIVLLRAEGQRQPRLLDFAVLLLGAFASRWMLVTLHNGQLSALLLLALAGFVALAKRGRDFWAGAALAAVMLKPNAFLLFAPLIGVWVVARRRWRIAAGGLATAVVVTVVTYALWPGWFRGWMVGREITELTIKVPSVWGVSAQVWPEWWPLAGLGLTVLVMGAAAVYIVRRRELDAGEAASVAVAASLLATPYTWPYEHLFLLIPLVMAAVRVGRRWPWAARIGWLLATVVIPWGLFFAISNRRGVDVVSALVPLGAGLVAVAVIEAGRRGGASRMARQVVETS